MKKDKAIEGLVGTGKGIPNTNKITSFFHCAKCLRELPLGESPESYARYSVGYTKIGLQIWCVRHNCNILHLDFAGTKFYANSTSLK